MLASEPHVECLFYMHTQVDPDSRELVGTLIDVNCVDAGGVWKDCIYVICDHDVPRMNEDGDPAPWQIARQYVTGDLQDRTEWVNLNDQKWRLHGFALLKHQVVSVPCLPAHKQFCKLFRFRKQR